MSCIAASLRARLWPAELFQPSVSFPMSAASRASAQPLVTSSSDFQSKTIPFSILIMFGDVVYEDHALAGGPLCRSLEAVLRGSDEPNQRDPGLLI